ncbi:hypothetical protein F0919_13590 [Taibaiella lutea]|uniref:Site-specific recombinase n=2 Tax=Taibaiella lutea TaxID=2608001 RepID=A0A5M6CET6_9BACT|nr:hypothetical protein F0919_13590 [Taibaiella lutea]
MIFSRVKYFYRNMVFYNKKDKGKNLFQIMEMIKTNADKNLYNMLFVELIAALRPKKNISSEILMQQLLEQLAHDKQLEEQFQKMFAELFRTHDSQSIFTSIGIFESGTFFSELFRQIRHSILPPVVDKRSLSHLLERAFSKKKDYIWVRSIPDNLWIEFFKIAAGSLIKEDTGLVHSLTNTLTELSFRVSYLGLESEISNPLKLLKQDINPFLEQNKKVQTLVHLLQSKNQQTAFVQSSAEDAIKILNECEKVIANIRAGTDKNGTSLGQSYILLRCSQLLKRIFIIIRFLAPEALPQHALINSVSFFKTVVESLNKQNSIADLYKKNSGMLAYQITEHKSASGEHLITTSRAEYKALFFSAAGCGVIISFAAFIKVLLQKNHIADFWQYFLYSLNYAIAFIIIYLAGATLATKQPAMTAAALAGSLDGRKGGVSLKGFAISFAKVWRTQFVCFAGNLIVVFPMSYLISFAWRSIMDMPLMVGEEVNHAINDQNPVTSLALYYGALTGVCLFISGIISGYMDNKAIYTHLKERLKQHDGLRRTFSAANLDKIANFFVHSLGGVVGYIALGFMLGYSTLIGKFFGIPFDTRHVTISTAYYGFGVESINNALSRNQWILTTLGIIGIGFFNFLVSFGLAFYVAMRSRNVPFSSLSTVARLVWKYVRKYPVDFIYPPREDRKEEEVFG